MNMPYQPGQPGGGMPQPAAAPQPTAPQQPQAPQPGAAPAAANGLPPELQRNIDPKNPVQALLLKRLDALSDEEQEALLGGVDEGAAQALKKLLPEVGFVIDYMMQQAGGGGDQGGMDDGGEEQGAAEQPYAPQQPQGMGGGVGGGMARTRLAGV
ncbi:hypothetical protein NKI25_18710 [Mesorhizobium sp. M0808]|uniref:hypothetical protein n=1 Tax=Mesorhizobium sp. M0808 TaxID=2957002 RepID=UPI00333A8041